MEGTLGESTKTFTSSKFNGDLVKSTIHNLKNGQLANWGDKDLYVLDTEISF